MPQVLVYPNNIYMHVCVYNRLCTLCAIPWECHSSCRNPHCVTYSWSRYGNRDSLGYGVDSPCCDVSKRLMISWNSNQRKVSLISLTYTISFQLSVWLAPSQCPFAIINGTILAALAFSYNNNSLLELNTYIIAAARWTFAAAPAPHVTATGTHLTDLVASHTIHLCSSNLFSAPCHAQ